MIVIPEEKSLLLITQGDHAHLAAELLSLCRFPELTAHARRRLLLEATREHDNGWRESDAAPSLDPTSASPYSYLTLPDAERRRVWTRACERFRDAEPYVALLITEHALALHRPLSGQGRWDDWLAEIETARNELLDEADCDLEALASDYALLRFADLCALACCGGSPSSFDYHGVAGMADDSTLYLDPLPLVGTTSFRVACRRVPLQAYGSDTELGVALATARWQRRTIRVTHGAG